MLEPFVVSDGVMNNINDFTLKDTMYRHIEIKSDGTIDVTNDFYDLPNTSLSVNNLTNIYNTYNNY